MTTVHAQQVFRVSPNIIFIPQDGVALDSSNGAVEWRYPRYLGATFVDGEGLILTSHIAGINRVLHFTETQLCRVRPNDGKPIWCRNIVRLGQAEVDASSRYFYLLHGNKLEVWSLEKGKHLTELKGLAGQLLTLPPRGALVIGGDQQHTDLVLFDPETARKQLHEIPRHLYAFAGRTVGALLYDPQAGTFLDPVSLNPLYHRQAPDQAAFPRASVNDSGFVFTDWNGTSPLLVGAAFGRAVWTYSGLTTEPRLFTTPRLAIALEKIEQTSPPLVKSRLTALELDSGKLLLAASVDGDFENALMDDDCLVLVNRDTAIAFDVATGKQMWHSVLDAGRPGVLADNSAVIWQASNLTGLDRKTGVLKWRVQFRTVPGGE